MDGEVLYRESNTKNIGEIDGRDAESFIRVSILPTSTGSKHAEGELNYFHTRYELTPQIVDLTWKNREAGVRVSQLQISRRFQTLKICIHSNFRYVFVKNFWRLR